MSARRFLTGITTILLTLLILSGCKFESSITPVDLAIAPPAPDFAFATLEPSFSTIDPLIVDSKPDIGIDNREDRVQAAIDAGDYQLVINLFVVLILVFINQAKYTYLINKSYTWIKYETLTQLYTPWIQLRSATAGECLKNT